MAIRERYQYVVDLITDNASRAVGSFGSNVDAAEQKTGRFQSTLGRAGSFLRENLANAATAAAGALITFAASATKAFIDTGIEAENLASLTGDTVEQSSRLNAIWKQSGADSKDLQDVLLQMNGVLSTNKGLVEELGIDMSKSATVGQRFEQVADALDKIPDAAKRSQIASQVFGEEGVRQYNALRTAVGDVGDAMAGVSEAQVIDDEEAARARALQTQLKQLETAVQSFRLALGGAIGDTVGDLLVINDAVQQLTGGFVEMTDVARGLVGPVGAATDILQRLGLLKDPVDELGFAAGRVADKGDELAVSFGEIDDRAEGVATALDNATSAADREEAQARRNIETTKRLTSEYNDQADQIDDLIGRKNALIGGDIAVRQAQRDARTATAELNTALEDQSLTLDDLAPIIDNATEANLNAAQVAADRRAAELEANGTLVDSKVKNQLLKEELQRLADQTNGPLRAAIQGYIDDLNRIPTSINTNITQNGTTDIRYGRQGFDAGTPLGGNKDTGVIVSAQSAGKQLPPINLTVNAGIGTDGRQVGRQIVEALEAFFRSGGQLPPTMAQRLGG